MTVPQQPFPQNPNPQQPQPGYGYAPQTPQPTGQQPGQPMPSAQPAPQYAQPGGAAPQPQQTAPGYGYPPQQVYGVQPGYGQPAVQAHKPTFLDALDVAKTTRISLILMVVFMGIDLFQSFISLLVGASFDYRSALYSLLNFAPWTYFTLALALFVIGLHVVDSVKWYRLTGFIILVAGAAGELLLQILYACHVYGIGTSLLSFLVYAVLLAHVIVLFVAHGHKG